jgi:dUTP pyrophosphatase
MINMKIKLAHPNAKVPTKSNFTDAGWDLFSVEDRVVKTCPYEIAYDTNEFGNPMFTRYWPNGSEIIKTGIHIQIPRGYVGLIWDRSGMACKHSIHRVAGVIDAGYRGELMVGLLNFGPAYEVKAGDKIAQLLIQEVPLHVSWETVEELDASDRGEKGFGSSGK